MRAAILFVLYGACCLLQSGASAGGHPVATVLPEGFVLDGIDGDLVRADGDDAWVCELAADVNEPGLYVPAGARFELLPSATLAGLIADVNDRAVPRYRLSARVTLFRNRNYLLPIYYLPLSKRQGPVPDGEELGRPAAEASGPASAELAVPREILDRLRDRRPVREPPRQRSQPPTVASAAARSRMLVERVGLIRTEGDRFVFTPYGLGRRVSDERFELLPSAALERALARQATLLEPIRVNAAGLVTQFEGGQYLLLQRTVPVYNYGNFVK